MGAMARTSPVQPTANDIIPPKLNPVEKNPILVEAELGSKRSSMARGTRYPAIGVPPAAVAAPLLETLGRDEDGRAGRLGLEPVVAAVPVPRCAGLNRRAGATRKRAGRDDSDRSRSVRRGCTRASCRSRRCCSDRSQVALCRTRRSASLRRSRRFSIPSYRRWHCRLFRLQRRRHREMRRPCHCCCRRFHCRPRSCASLPRHPSQGSRLPELPAIPPVPVAGSARTRSAARRISHARDTTAVRETARARIGSAGSIAAGASATRKSAGDSEATRMRRSLQRLIRLGRALSNETFFALSPRAANARLRQSPTASWPRTCW